MYIKTLPLQTLQTDLYEVRNSAVPDAVGSLGDPVCPSSGVCATLTQGKQFHHLPICSFAFILNNAYLNLDQKQMKIEGDVPKTVQKIIFTLDDQTKKSTFFSVDGTGTFISFKFPSHWLYL